MNHRHINFSLSFALFIAIIAVSTASILIRFAQRDAPSLTIAALRLTFASLVLAPIAWERHRGEILNLTRRELLLSVCSGLFLAVHFAAWITSLAFTSVASSVVLVSTGPLWVALLSPMILNERLAHTAIFGLGLALIGGVLIGLSSGCTWMNGLYCSSMGSILQGRDLWGNFLALAGAWAVTGYLIIGRRLRGTMSLIPYISITYSAGAVASLGIMFAAGQSPFGYPAITYLWLLLLALVPQLIGHSTYNWALRFAPATSVALTTLGEPIGSAILAYLILQEEPTFPVLFGGALILTGIYFASGFGGKKWSSP